MNCQDPKIEKRTDCKRPYWYIRPYIDILTAQGIVRRQQRVNLGCCDEVTLKQARVEKAKHMVLINDPKRFIEAQLPFECVVEKYRKAVYPLLAHDTQKKYDGYLNNRILPAFGKLELRKIDTPAVQALINQANTLGWYAKHDLRNIISAVFTYARQTGCWSGGNPCECVRMGRKTTVRETRKLTDAEIIAFQAALFDTAICSAAEASLMVDIATTTGYRVSEILGLQVRDFNVAEQTLRADRAWVRGHLGPTKTENSRQNREITPELAEALVQQAKGKKREAFLFARENGQPPDERDLQQHVFRPAAEKAGIYFPGFGMHSLRREYVTLLQEEGASSVEAMKRAGHGSLRMTALYTQLDRRREREQIERIWARLHPKQV